MYVRRGSFLRSFVFRISVTRRALSTQISLKGRDKQLSKVMNGDLEPAPYLEPQSQDLPQSSLVPGPSEGTVERGTAEREAEVRNLNSRRNTLFFRGMKKHSYHLYKFTKVSINFYLDIFCSKNTLYVGIPTSPI